MIVCTLHQMDLPLSVPKVCSQGVSRPIPDAAQGLSLTQNGPQSLFWGGGYPTIQPQRAWQDV